MMDLNAHKESEVKGNAVTKKVKEEKKCPFNCAVDGGNGSDWPVHRRRGLRPAAGALERDLWCWCISKGKVSKNLIQLRARWLFQQAGITDFKASDGWYKRWVRRWKQYTKESGLASHDTETSKTAENKDKGDEIITGISEHYLEQFTLSNQFVPSTTLDTIVTPSLGDTLDSTFPCLEMTGSPAFFLEDTAPHEEVIDDTKLTTPKHDSFEQYSRVSKVFRNANNVEVHQCSYVYDFRDSGEETSKLQQATDSTVTKNVCSKNFKEENSLTQGEDSHKKGRVHQVGKRYHPQFKERVLSYLKSHTLKETAQKFGVHRGSIRDWQKAKLLRKLAHEDKTKVDLLAPAPAPADVQFLTWLRRERGRPVSIAEVRACARRLVALAGGLRVVERQVRWFALWVGRFDDKPYEEGTEDSERDSLDKHRVQYPPAFRIEVAAYAAKYSQMAAVRTFNVSRKRVFQWLRAYYDASGTTEEIPSSARETHRSGSGRIITDPEVDRLVWQWYCDTQSRGNPCPSSHEVRAHASALYAARGLSDKIRCSYGWYRRWCERFGVRLRYSADDVLLAWVLAQLDCNHALSHAHLQEQARNLWKTQKPDFKASPGWAIRFCKRHPKLLQSVPSIATPLPESLRPLVSQFRSTVQENIKSYLLPASAVGNMDELPLVFSAPPVGAPKKQLLLRKPGMDACHATVVLSCLADGMLLPTMLILKDAVDFPVADPNLIVLQQDNGQMDLACMQKWLNGVWFLHASEPSLLVADCFGPHCAPEVAEQFTDGPNRNKLLQVIPAGCSSKLQPLDVNVKRTFQRYLDQQWERLNTRAGSGWGFGQQLRLPSAGELVQWVADAHRYVMMSCQETIRRSFLVTGMFKADGHDEEHFIENPAALLTEENHFLNLKSE